ncbi:MAG: hypothetical protein QNJ73_01175 [Gammaproteobacteria bacterium]|nr:hypothetical protein [Gammaproteobacteria bacterium]
MKCFYYVTPTLDSTHSISDDLQELGIGEWMVHVVTKDEAGLKREQIQSSNYIETLDVVRGGLIGANIGFIVGVIGAAMMAYFDPFQRELPWWVYLIVVLVSTLFGAWEGGLYGVATENQKLNRFHDDIEAGKYLILIYARKGMGETVKDMMRQKHPEAQHVATDRQFVNPFGVVRRRRRQREEQRQEASRQQDQGLINS